MNITWDANTYHTDFSFVNQYGNSVIEWMETGKNHSVLDLGCGDGTLTAVLREKGCRATGLDASGELLELARKNHPDIPFIQGDAADFSLPEPVDAVFSNAVLHWIERERQPGLLGCVKNALKQNGEFVFEFGGHGNNRLIHEGLETVFAAHRYVYQMPFYFPTIGEYAALLEQAGFRVTQAVLFDRPTWLKGEDGLKSWMRIFLKTPFSVIDREEEAQAVLDQTAELLRPALYQGGSWYADYVRLRMRAVRL